MRLIVDASVAVEWIVPEEQEAAAEAILHGGADTIAPELLLVEVANAMRTKLSRGQIELTQARAGLDFVSATVSKFIVDGELVGRAFEIPAETGHSVYDCLYLACAKRENAQMMTADRRLAERVATGPFRKRVQMLPN